MSGINWEELYKRYNQFGEYHDACTVMKQYTMLQIFVESKKISFDMEKRILEYERLSYGMEGFQGLKYESMIPQPKSIFMRIHLLGIVADAIPDEFYDEYKSNAQSIVGITMAIALYYLGY